MALLTGVLVSVTELIKMHMFGIIHRLSRPGRGETKADLCKLSAGVFKPDRDTGHAGKWFWFVRNKNDL